jgi:hypothetical protein
MTVIVIVQPEWVPEYGVRNLRMKLAFYAAIDVPSSVCSNCCTFLCLQQACTDV